MKQTTLRIPDGLHSEVSTYAESIGVSVNQLALIALKDYLLARSAAPQAVRDSAPPPPASEAMPGGTPAMMDSESDDDISRLAKLAAKNARRHEKKPKKRRR